VTDQHKSTGPCEGLAKLQQALKKNRRDAHHRYFQLATVAADGAPRNRTVVFRGFAPQEDGLLVITDTRSEKMAELSAQCRAEVAWYFTHTREQFRLRVRVNAITPDEQDAGLLALRERVWTGLSDPAREQFFWRSPGRPLGEGERPAVGAGLPGTFAVLVLQPDYIDHLVLAKVQTRHLSRFDHGDWHEQSLNP